MTSCAPGPCQCTCHNPGAAHVAHVVACCPGRAVDPCPGPPIRMTTTAEQELKWSEQDLRVAADNLDAAKRRLDDASEEYDDAQKAVTAAKKALQQEEGELGAGV